MTNTVTREVWNEAREALLAKEKEATRVRDELAKARRELPRVEVTEPYTFEDAGGTRSLLDLFDGKRQLVVYHFMFAPEWDAGCKSCSLVSEIFDGTLAHLAARDTAFVAISRAPLAKIEAFEKRMGWRFRWVSSASFNTDFGFTRKTGSETRDLPGLSTFVREGDRVFHTYSTTARGLDAIMGTYQLLDFTPLGRQEEGLDFTMTWVRHHDAYGARGA